MSTSIFITYNPKSEFEQTLAIRLHTIGVSNGFSMYLPDRYNSETVLDDETKYRIRKASYVVMFSTSNLSTIVKKEIEFAFTILRDKKKIIVVYDKKRGKNLSGKITTQFTSIYVDEFPNEQDKVLHEIINTIQTQEIYNLTKEKKEAQALAALFGVGLGLLMLGSSSTSNK